jgi:hypothetical protein
MGFPLSCAVRERERKIPQNDCEMCMVSAGLRRARGLDTKTYFCVFKLKITFSY